MSRNGGRSRTAPLRLRAVHAAAPLPAPSSISICGAGEPPASAATWCSRRVRRALRDLAPYGFRPTTFVPSYGMAETTLAFSFAPLDTASKSTSSTAGGWPMSAGAYHRTKAIPNGAAVRVCGPPLRITARRSARRRAGVAGTQHRSHFSSRARAYVGPPTSKQPEANAAGARRSRLARYRRSRLHARRPPRHHRPRQGPHHRQRPQHLAARPGMGGRRAAEPARATPPLSVEGGTTRRM